MPLISTCSYQTKTRKCLISLKDMGLSGVVSDLAMVFPDELINHHQGVY